MKAIDKLIDTVVDILKGPPAAKGPDGHLYKIGERYLVDPKNPPKLPQTFMWQIMWSSPDNDGRVVARVAMS